MSRGDYVTELKTARSQRRKLITMQEKLCVMSGEWEGFQGRRRLKQNAWQRPSVSRSGGLMMTLHTGGAAAVMRTWADRQHRSGGVQRDPGRVSAVVFK